MNALALQEMEAPVADGRRFAVGPDRAVHAPVRGPQRAIVLVVTRDQDDRHVELSGQFFRPRGRCRSDMDIACQYCDVDIGLRNRQRPELDVQIRHEKNAGHQGSPITGAKLWPYAGPGRVAYRSLGAAARRSSVWCVMRDFFCRIDRHPPPRHWTVQFQKRLTPVDARAPSSA